MRWLRRREIAAAVCVTLLCLAVRIWFARKVNFCGTPDSCYALGLAQSLASYHAFHAWFLFDLQVSHPHIPNTGLEYWRPGVSLILYLFRSVGGTTLHGSLVITALAGALWAAAAWFVAMRATGNARIALASYTLCLVLPPGWESSLTPDPTLFYAAAIAWFLALFTVRRQGLAQDIVALFCVSAAYMIRNDAGLLLVPLLVVLVYRWRGSQAARVRGEAPTRGSSVGYCVAIVTGFLLALVPMHLVYQHVLGTAFPPGASKALYLNDLSDFNSYGSPVNMHTMLSRGIGHLLAMRIGAVATIVYRVLALVLGYTALVFLPALGTRNDAHRNEIALPELAGPVSFGAAILLVYSIVLPAVGVFSALRSSTGLLPVASVLVVVAILRIARTRRLALALTLTAVSIYVVSGVMDDRRTVDPLNAIGATDRAEAEALAAMGARPNSGAIVMTPDPVQFSVTTGYPAIPMPGNGSDAITNEALDLHASYAILDGDQRAAVRKSLHPAGSATILAQPVILLKLPSEPKQR